MTLSSGPRLRPVEAQWIQHDGQQLLLLRDRLGIAQRVVAVPQILALVLGLMDGQRDASGLRAAFQLRTGIDLPLEAIERMLQTLDEALLLDSPRYHEAAAEALAIYRAAPYREPALAGGVYSGDPEELGARLAEYVEQGKRYQGGSEVDGVRAVVSPHIDFQRGGPLYGATWSRVERAAREADLVVLFGTDHNGSPGTLTLTRQNYCTPLGALHTEQHLVDVLVDAMAPVDPFAEELHHRSEHSIELAAVWLTYARRGAPVPVVPILCGSFHFFTEGLDEPSASPVFDRVISALRDATAGRKVFWVAAADLAHVGPQFGDASPWGPLEKATLHADDHSLIEHVARGNGEAFFGMLRDERDRRRICGLPPIYLLLRSLGATEGELIGYDQCPADEQQASWVSIAGMVLR